jgi:hypothetical protein
MCVLDVAEVFVELIEPRLPHLPVLVDPLDR